MTKKQILKAFEKTGCKLTYKEAKKDSYYHFLCFDGKEHEVRIIGEARDDYYGITIIFYDGLVAIYINTYRGRENIAFCPYSKITSIEYKENDYDYTFVLNGICEF